MAAASFLSLKWNPLFERLPTENRSVRQTSLTVTTRFLRLPKPYSIKCSDSSSVHKNSRKKRNETLKTLAEDRNPIQGILDAILKTLKSLQKPAIVAVLLGVLLTCDPHSAALAASGGRMGGRAFSSSSGSSSSRSYSVPSSPGFSYSVPYYAPSPFFGGGGGLYVGPAFGVGVGAGSGFFLLMMGFAAAILVSGFLSDRSEDGGVLTATQKTSVLKLQVWLGFEVLMELIELQQSTCLN